MFPHLRVRPCTMLAAALVLLPLLPTLLLLQESLLPSTTTPPVGAAMSLPAPHLLSRTSVPPPSTLPHGSLASLPNPASQAKPRSSSAAPVKPEDPLSAAMSDPFTLLLAALAAMAPSLPSLQYPDILNRIAPPNATVWGFPPDGTPTTAGASNSSAAHQLFDSVKQPSSPAAAFLQRLLQQVAAQIPVLPVACLLAFLLVSVVHTVLLTIPKVEAPIHGAEDGQQQQPVDPKQQASKVSTHVAAAAAALQQGVDVPADAVTLVELVSRPLFPLLAGLDGWHPSVMPDLAGKVALVTGARCGLGREICRVLASKNCHVIMVGRCQAGMRRAVELVQAGAGSHGKVEAMGCDLSSFKSIKALADAVQERVGSGGLDILVHNAGEMLAAHKETTEGFDHTMMVNYISMVALTQLLRGCLRENGGGRVVVMSSIMEALGVADLDDLRGVRTISRVQLYSRTKLYCLMYANHLATMLRPVGVDVFAVHPGGCSTHIMRQVGQAQWVGPAFRLVTRLYRGQPVEFGAVSALYAATAPDLAGKGGGYYGPSYWLFNWGNTCRRSPSNAAACDLLACKQLYNRTLEIIRPFLAVNNNPSC